MRILVVDDSSPHRRMLTAIFGHAGHQVLTAADGEAALALLERESVNAVVSDVRMPKLDGFQLCRAIRRDARWARLPFIFYSSVFIGGPARDLGRDVGATAYLDAKDITPQQMARELESLVDRHVRAEYQETLVRLLDDVDFARRYHQVVIDTLSGAGREDMRDRVEERRARRALEGPLTWGAPTWPPTPPGRSERPGKPVALLHNTQAAPKASRPVTSRPTMRVWMSWVPS